MIDMESKQWQPPQILLDMDSLLGLVKFLLMKEGKTD